ncbi:MAG: S9 family peptidase [Thermoanaerobaculia bacterium]|nr:S9 family peptidase [Thermoanaerobaculia bacterium]
MKRISLLLCLILAAGTASAQKRAFTIEDLYRVKSASELTLAADGRTAAFTLTSYDLPRAKKTSRIWTAASDGQRVRAITQGEKDSTPLFSPDGKSLAFIREKDGLANLWLLPMSGGEPRQLTSISTGLWDPVWSPDSRFIAFVTDVYPECGGDDACSKKISDTRGEGKLKAHMSDELLYRHWNAWRDGMISHTWLIDVESGETRDVTPGRNDFPPFQLGGAPQYDVSPDASELVISANPDAKRASSTNNDLYLIPLKASGEPRNITAANPAYDSSPKYSPDGRYIAYRTQRDPGYESSHVFLALYDRRAGTTRTVSTAFNNWVDDFRWSADSKSIFFTGPVEGRTPIYRYDLASQSIAPVVDDRQIDDFEIAPDGKSIIYIGRSVGEPTELFRLALGVPARGASAARMPLTRLNETLAKEVDIRPAEVMWVTGANGARVQVFIVKPHGFDPAKKYPLILNVHGGPQQQWTDAFRGDWQVYPGAGYVVAFPNPHGSTGFGQEFTAAISGDWGGRPYEDVMRVTDALEKLPYVDRDRIGAMGWSYGGYMMNWIAGHTDRYKALASMMGIFDLRSFYYSTEELWFPEWDLRGAPWESDQYEKWSPSNFVKNFKTPTLVITGQIDFRVPYSQSVMMFTALQKMNVPSRLIIFPEAGHWPAWNEMAFYYTAHLDWFHKYLGGSASPWTPDDYLRNQVFDVSAGKRR